MKKQEPIKRFLARFFSKVRIKHWCWEWTGSKNPAGYGRFQVSGKSTRAHRISYELAKGKIPTGLQIDHLCRNRACVNPSHLEIVTRKENILRGIAPSAINSRKTRCIHGHEFTPENTSFTPNGKRDCRKCKAQNTLKWNQRNKIKIAEYKRRHYLKNRQKILERKKIHKHNLI